MVHITIKKGLDIPIEGKPFGAVQLFQDSNLVALNLEPYSELKFKLLVKEGDQVALGQPLVEDKNDPLRIGISPSSGTIRSIIRGEKRRLIAITIEKDNQFHALKTNARACRNLEDVILAISQSGLFLHIRCRPFNRLAGSTDRPRSIFIKAVETAPFSVPPELQTIGYETAFQNGLHALNLLCPNGVNLVFSQNSSSSIFRDAVGVRKHTVYGPHPAGNASVHIEHIDPIQSPQDIVWTCTAWDVVALGRYLETGVPHLQRVISIGGEGIKQAHRGFVKVNIGTQVSDLLTARVEPSDVRIIVGDPLMGRKALDSDFIGACDFQISAIPEASNDRLMFHFMRLGGERYSASRAYLSGIRKPSSHLYHFTTSQHGEERAFIDGSIYEKVMPLKVLPMQIVKACLANDYERACEYGLLSVVPEDFALCEFICPSKVEMVDIVRKGLQEYAKEIIG